MLRRELKSITAIQKGDHRQPRFHKLGGGEGKVRIGKKVDATEDHLADTWASYRTWTLNPSTPPSSLTGEDEEINSCYNQTGRTLGAAVLHFVLKVDGGYALLPAELEPCPEPERDVQNI